MTQSVYCGPNWLKYGLQKYQVFIDGYGFNVKEAFAECPELEKLCCSPEELDSFRFKIATQGTRESRFYESAEKYINSTRKRGGK